MSEPGGDEPVLWQECRVDVVGDTAEETDGTGRFLLSDLTQCWKSVSPVPPTDHELLKGSPVLFISYYQSLVHRMHSMDAE